jgi:hypothetical protein
MVRREKRREKNRRRRFLNSYKGKRKQLTDKIESYREQMRQLDNEVSKTDLVLEGVEYGIKKLYDRLMKETDGFFDDEGQLNTYMRHLESADSKKHHYLDRLRRAYERLQNDKDEMTRSNGEMDNLKRNNDFDKREIEVLIEELEMELSELDEEYEELKEGNRKIDQESILNKKLDADVVGYRYNREKKLPPMALRYLYKEDELQRGIRDLEQKVENGMMKMRR